MFIVDFQVAEKYWTLYLIFRFFSFTIIVDILLWENVSLFVAYLTSVLNEELKDVFSSIYRKSPCDKKIISK